MKTLKDDRLESGLILAHEFMASWCGIYEFHARRARKKATGKEGPGKTSNTELITLIGMEADKFNLYTVVPDHAQRYDAERLRQLGLGRAAEATA